MTFKRPCDRICHGVICVFNEEIKERYLQESMANKGTIMALEHLYEAEEITEKELCSMDRNEAIKAVGLICGYDLHSINNTISCWKSYARWCYDNGYFKNEKYGILGISASNINPQEYIREYVFQTEEELFNSIKSVTQIHEGYISVIACVFAWIGIGEPLEIHDKDISIDKREIACNGNIIVNGFSDAVFNYLLEYSKLEETTRENGMMEYTVVKDHSYDLFIKRFCSPRSSKLGKPITSRMITNAINKLNQKYESAGNPPRITYTNILKSGSLNRLYNAEINGLKVFDKDNEEIVKSYFYRSNYRSIIWLYRHYKQAFNL